MDGGASMDGETILALVSQHHRRTKCIVVTGHEGVGKSRLRNYFKEFDVFDYVGKDDFDLIEFKKIVDQAFYFHGYRLLTELGRGGMSTVYKALDPQNGNRVVAIKVLHQDPRLSPDEVTQRLARFDQEVETIRKLDHPNIVALYDYRADTEATEDQVFFVMEYLNGPTLEAVLADGQCLPQAQVVEIGLQLCDALAYAHARQVVHRDVKPSNIILTAEGQVKVTDFGIAKVMDTGSSLTRTEEIVGTLDYMPPEQILYAKGVDHRVDIYATGVVLYELLSGEKPYHDPLLKLKGDPVPLGEVTAEVPDSLAAVVMHALAPEPDERYQTANNMIKALRAC
jgi:serine/threonine protein kinase